MGFRLLVEKGALQLKDPGQAADFLRSRPPGAYTTTRTVDSASCVLLWERHLARLAQSIELLTSGIKFDSRAMFELVNPSLKIGYEEALHRITDEMDLIITILARTDNESLDVSVHIASLTPVPIAPASVAVMGPSRETPLAKSSQWVNTRQVLEQYKPQNVAEVLLSNDGRHLLEGLTTNFFVVLNAENGAGVTVQTAALENGVLPGVVRQLIIEICTEKNISIVEATPSWEDRHIWKEAFITSSVRLIQPVKSVQVPVPWNAGFNKEKWQSDWQSMYLEATGPVTQILQKEVLDRAKTYGYSLIDSKHGRLEMYQ